MTGDEKKPKPNVGKKVLRFYDRYMDGHTAAGLGVWPFLLLAIFLYTGGHSSRLFMSGKEKAKIKAAYVERCVGKSEEEQIANACAGYEEDGLDNYWKSAEAGEQAFIFEQCRKATTEDQRHAYLCSAYDDKGRLISEAAKLQARKDAENYRSKIFQRDIDADRNAQKKQNFDQLLADTAK